MEMYSLTIGERILVLRNRAHYTKKDLAEIAEVTPATISNYENNVSIPDQDTIEKISMALGVTMNFLAYGFDDAKKDEEIKPLV